MRITEELVRLIARETISVLGPRANPPIVKKVSKEVLKRLSESTGHEAKS